jgi:hypothetical protein
LGGAHVPQTDTYFGCVECGYIKKSYLKIKVIISA